jgi:hypothetical protein
VNRNVQILEKEGVVKIRSVGRMKMIRLDHENPRTHVILKALRMLRNADLTQFKEVNDLKTVKVSDEVHRKLTRILGELTAKSEDYDLQRGH